MSGRYLRVTIHDNDFTSSLLLVGELLHEVFQKEERYPSEEDFPVLKGIIRHLWFGADVAEDLMRWGEPLNKDVGFFDPKLEFVESEDIPEWDNKESVYIPMFDDGDVLRR